MNRLAVHGMGILRYERVAPPGRHGALVHCADASSPAVAAEAGQPDDPGWDPMEGPAAWERELGVEELTAEPSFVGAAVDAWK